MVLHNCDRNAILAEPLKSHKDYELLQALKALYRYVIDLGIHQQLYILYNEFSAGMKISIQMAGAQHQLVPPALHHALISEQSIRTFKQHFIDGLSICEPKFLSYLWGHLIQQAVLTLNLLCPARLNPRLSTKSLLNRAFGFN